MRRNQRLAALAGHEREVGRYDPSATSPNELGDWPQTRGQRCDFRSRLSRASVGAEGMNEVVLQIAHEEGDRGARTLIVYPSR